MRVLEASVRLLMFRLKTPIVLLRPNPVLLANAPLTVVEIPSPILSVPPVINLAPPVAADQDVPATALWGSTIVIVPPVQLTVVEAPIVKTTVPAARFVADCGSTLMFPPLMMNWQPALLANETAPLIF